MTFFKRFGRYGRFAVSGTMGAISFYLLLFLFVEFKLFSVMAATSIAFILVVTQNYILHYHWTFKSASPHLSSAPKFFLMSATGFCLNWGIMFYGVEVWGLHYFWVQTVALTIVVLWNYLISFFWIF